MSDIKTWIERCEKHPDHQSGMISEGMIRARMCEEIDDLRAENERLRAEIDELYRAAGRTRAALSGWILASPDDREDELTHALVAAVVAEVERLRAIVALRVLEGKP